MICRPVPFRLAPRRAYTQKRKSFERNQTGDIVPKQHQIRALFASCTFIVVFALGGPAHALQPLAAFLAEAEHLNPDVVAARATALQYAAEASAAGGRLLPNIGLTGSYTRNEYAASFELGGRKLTFAPYDQLDAQALLTVPVIDVVAWAKRTIAWAQSDMAKHDARRSAVDIAKQVAQQYYRLAAAEGVRDAAERSAAVATEQAHLVQARLSEGAASSLEMAQAESDEAAAQQSVASAKLSVSLAARVLETLSGLTPEPGGGVAEVSLHAEKPIEAWLAYIDGTLPALAQSRSAERAARASNNAASYAYIPSVTATASERYTNAAAFNGGHPHVWQVKANLAWNFDLSLTPMQQAQRHKLAAASAKARYSARQLADQLYTDYQQIEANRAKSSAARAQVKATSLGETLAFEKRQAGVITQLDVLQARRDAFSAQVNRVSADADLLLYRALLRLDAGIGALAEGPQ